MLRHRRAHDDATDGSLAPSTMKTKVVAPPDGRTPSGSAVPTGHPYEPHDCNNITVGSARVRCHKLPLLPSFIRRKQAASYTTFQSTMKEVVDIRKDRYSNVGYSGGTTTLNVERLFPLSRGDSTAVYRRKDSQRHPLRHVPIHHDS